MNLRSTSLVAVMVALLMMTGCATKAPNYQFSPQNVTTLKNAGNTPAGLGEFKVQAGMTGAESIGLRAVSMQSPVGANYAAYLAEALKLELDMARRFDPKAHIQISGVLLKNDIAAGGISRNSGEIEARFMVHREGQVKFDQIKRAKTEWESSFAGMIAIPKAQEQYPILVQELLKNLYADEQFQSAIH
jgi:hypothetical protein